MKNLIILLTIIFSYSFINISTGQTSETLKKYRVTAYKSTGQIVSSCSNEVEVIKLFSLYVPNAFTPNGDGLNDMFSPAGTDISEFKMQIFNRWGEMIFESNDINDQWDGTFGSNLVPIGTYAYAVYAKSYENGNFSKSGTVNVIL